MSCGSRRITWNLPSATRMPRASKRTRYRRPRCVQGVPSVQTNRPPNKTLSTSTYQAKWSEARILSQRMSGVSSPLSTGRRPSAGVKIHEGSSLRRSSRRSAELCTRTPSSETCGEHQHSGCSTWTRRSRIGIMCCGFMPARSEVSAASAEEDKCASCRRPEKAQQSRSTRPLLSRFRGSRVGFGLTRREPLPGAPLLRLFGAPSQS